MPGILILRHQIHIYSLHCFSLGLAQPTCSLSPSPPPLPHTMRFTLLRELLNIPSNVRLFSPSVLFNSYKQINPFCTVSAKKFVLFSYFNRYYICTVYGTIITTNKGRTISLQNSYPLCHLQKTLRISYFNQYFIRTTVLTNEQSEQNRNNQGSKLFLTDVSH